jgi:hypothetical protein
LISFTTANHVGLRSRLHDCAQALSVHSESSSSFTQPPTSTSAQLNHPYPEYRPLSDQLRTRWNAVVERSVVGVETLDWNNVLGGVYDGVKGVVERATGSTGGPGNLRGEDEGVMSSIRDRLRGVGDAASRSVHNVTDHLHLPSTPTASTTNPVHLDGSVERGVEALKKEELIMGDLIRGRKEPFEGRLNDPVGRRVEKALGTDDVGRGRLV